MALQHTNVIDLIAQDPTTNEVVLGIIELRPWEESDRRIFELQEKVNAYLSFALDGEMHAHFPQFSELTVHLRLDTVEPPTPQAEHFIGIIREQIGFQGILFSVRVMPDLAEKMAAMPASAMASSSACCGGGCGCGDPAPATTQAAQSGCCGGESGGNEGSCGCS